MKGFMFHTDYQRGLRVSTSDTEKRHYILKEIVKMEIEISFLLYITSANLENGRAQGGINWEDTAPYCFAMRVKYKKILFWMLLNYQRMVKVMNHNVMVEWSLMMLYYKCKAYVIK